MFVGSFTAQAATINMAVTTTASTPVVLPGSGSSIRIVNYGPNNVYISVAKTATPAVLSSATASSASCPILAGTDVSFSVQGTVNFISAITATGTAVLDVQVGEGQ